MKFTLTATDTMASVLQSMNSESGVTQQQSYSAYGDTVKSASNTSLPGFNGERRDPLTGTTHLGNGYRAYNPTLMRFHAPDSMSPFGAGGINCYAYCNGDPINNSDPSGHMSAQAGVGIGLGILGIITTAVSGGIAISAAGSVAAAWRASSTFAKVAGGVGIVADVAAIATGAVSETSPEDSSALAWTSMVLGAVGIIGSGAAVKNAHSLRKTRKYGTQFLGTSITQGSDAITAYAIPTVDHESGIKRLNVIAHGNKGGAYINDTFMDGASLFKHLSENVYDVKRYDEFFLMICHSAETPHDGMSLARGLSNASKRDVIGHKGSAWEIITDNIDSASSDIIQKYGNTEKAYKKMKDVSFIRQPDSTPVISSNFALRFRPH